MIHDRCLKRGKQSLLGLFLPIKASMIVLYTLPFVFNHDYTTTLICQQFCELRQFIHTVYAIKSLPMNYL